MGWESRYYKRPGAENSIQAQVFDKLVPIGQAKAQWERDLAVLKNPTVAQMERAVACIVKILGAIDDMKYNAFKDKEAVQGLVQAYTAIVPSTSAANIVDFITMAADKVLQYADYYRNAMDRDYGLYTQEQKAVLSYLDRKSRKDMTVKQWGVELLDIAEYAMEYLRNAGAEKAAGGWSKLFKESKASMVSDMNVDALVLYVRETRPVLYFYSTAKDTTTLGAVK